MKRLALVLLIAFSGACATLLAHHQERPLPISHQVKAQALALGTRSCALDVHEACLVCLHREVQGILVSTYC